MTIDVIVLGGGAAGLFCAARAGRRGRRVVLLERNREVGRKILISGGGRCNFTNLHCRPENFLSTNPHFARSALARFSPADFVALVERAGIAYHEKTLGQLFCDGSAQQIVDLLVDECRKGKVDIVTDADVLDVAAHDSYVGRGFSPASGAPYVGRGFSPAFTVTTTTGVYSASSLVVATGGLSIPKIGATDLGYRIARQFGVPVVPTRPALVPLLFAQPDLRRWHDMAGVATECIASAGGASFRERLLFTHRGLSGPAILQASSYWREGESIAIDLLPDVDVAAELVQRRATGDTSTLKSAVARHVPARLAERWFEDDPGGPIATVSNERIAAASEGLHRWQVAPSGTEGFSKAEVTAGGVDTRALSSKTMECTEVPGLYFIGEVVDVTGHLGGFNFQWAWASAAAAAAAL